MKKVFKVCGVLLTMFMFLACGKEEKKTIYVGTNADMKKVFKVCGVLLTMFMFLACGKEEKKTIYVGTNAEFPPFEYLEKDQMVGFDVDFINAIGKEMGKEIVMKDMSFDGLLPALQSKKVDLVIAGMTASEERKKAVNFSEPYYSANLVMKDMSFDGLLPALQSKKVDLVIAGMTASEERKKAVNFSEPYYSANQVIVLQDTNNDIKTFDDLKGKKIGVMLGFTGDLVITEMGLPSEKFSAMLGFTGDLVITEMGLPSEKFSAAYAGIMALQNGKLDAVVLDSETAKNYVKNNKGLKLAESEGEAEDYAIAVRKEDKQLLDDVNKAIATLKSNGEFEKILKKYFN